MDIESLNNLWNELVAHYGDDLPDPEQQPKEFKYYVKLYTYVKNADLGADAAHEQADQSS
jgi:hypothetical protein